MVARIERVEDDDGARFDLVAEEEFCDGDGAVGGDGGADGGEEGGGGEGVEVEEGVGFGED